MFEQLLKALIQRLQKDRPVMDWLIVPVQEADRIPEKKPRLFEPRPSVSVDVYT